MKGNDKMLEPKNTIVIADFDGTFSKRYIDGKPVLFMMQILEEFAELPPQFAAQIAALREKYYPYEIDPTLSQEFREQKIMEWWQACFEVMKEMGLTKTMILKIARDPRLQLREGVAEFLSFTAQNSIPVVINSSAGIAGVVIPAVLSDRGLLSNNIKIVANDFNFDSFGKFIGVSGPIITAVNKNGQMLVKKGVYRDREKSSCLLIGDGFGDAQMADGLKFEKIYKVAFAEKNLEKFREIFDEVLDINSGFFRITELFT